MSRRVAIVLAVVVLGVWSSPALGQRPVPKKANKYQATLVTNIEDCTVGATSTGGTLDRPACQPVVPADPVCVFGPDGKGSGKILAKAKDDIKLQAKLTGLAPSCNGETLCMYASFRLTQADCADPGDCTSEPQIDYPLGNPACCDVANGKCLIKTTLNTGNPGAVFPGDQAEFIIGEIGLGRSAATQAFKAGLFIP